MARSRQRNPCLKFRLNCRLNGTAPCPSYIGVSRNGESYYYKRDSAAGQSCCPPSFVLRRPSSSLWYNPLALGRVRRGRDLRTPSGPEGSSGKKVSLGAAGVPARVRFING